MVLFVKLCSWQKDFKHYETDQTGSILGRAVVESPRSLASEAPSSSGLQGRQGQGQGLGVETWTGVRNVGYIQGQASRLWGGPQSRLSCPPPTSVAESWAPLGLVETVVVNLAELVKVVESRL